MVKLGSVIRAVLYLPVSFILLVNAIFVRVSEKLARLLKLDHPGRKGAPPPTCPHLRGVVKRKSCTDWTALANSTNSTMIGVCQSRSYSGSVVCGECFTRINQTPCQAGVGFRETSGTTATAREVDFGAAKEADNAAAVGIAALNIGESPSFMVGTFEVSSAELQELSRGNRGKGLVSGDRLHRGRVNRGHYQRRGGNRGGGGGYGYNRHPNLHNSQRRGYNNYYNPGHQNHRRM